MTADCPAPAPNSAADAGESHLVEAKVRSEQLLKGNFLNIFRDTVRLPNGAEATREYVTHPGAMVVIPILDDGRLVLERQYRYPLSRVILEFPAGKLDPGESHWHCAIRELAEETGYRAREWALATTIHNAAAYSNEFIEVWFARGLSLGDRQLDDGEFIDVVELSEAELDALAARGELTDVKTLVGLLWLQKWRAGLWHLPWQAAP
jgi:ADP-ribose pyrophosphatase